MQTPLYQADVTADHNNVITRRPGDKAYIHVIPSTNNLVNACKEETKHLSAFLIFRKIIAPNHSYGDGSALAGLLWGAATRELKTVMKKKELEVKQCLSQRWVFKHYKPGKRRDKPGKRRDKRGKPKTGSHAYNNCIETRLDSANGNETIYSRCQTNNETSEPETSYKTTPDSSTSVAESFNNEFSTNIIKGINVSNEDVGMNSSIDNSVGNIAYNENNNFVYSDFMSVNVTDNNFVYSDFMSVNVTDNNFMGVFTGDMNLYDSVIDSLDGNIVDTFLITCNLNSENEMERVSTNRF
ncbi:11503_t:CDS:1 [Paraglomus brasilianum]|uniref:11503_t:CDS:1 n=1 Tax=Paraglomus brasilianum TaxID=144538 RepID=A0A9N9F5P5_9GLOM|nr:11503_t:CDS:1 [Paraglomus brasilianum]